MPLNETICALTFLRLFEFSDYIVAIEIFRLSLCLSWRCCNKLDIIWVPTLGFSFSYLECMSNNVYGNLAPETTAISFYHTCKTMTSLQLVHAAASLSVCVITESVGIFLWGGGFPVHKCWEMGEGVCVLAGLHVCYLSALSWQVEKKCFPSLSLFCVTQPP